mgnify:CR=1 FL=1
MKIETVYTLRQPMSHIGESESTVSFLNTIRIAVDGKVNEVFALTGNAIRGTLRDCAARNLLDMLGIKLKKKEFNILFSGGNISGTLSTDIDQAKSYRDMLPIISIFGAGVGNQILSGKMTQSFAMPVCRETVQIIPDIAGIDKSMFQSSWKQMTGTINFTRFDDSKNVKYHEYLNGEEDNTDKNSASTQMRYEVEYMVPGTQLYHIINLCTEDRIEIGAFVSALQEFSKSPILGGMGGKGFGICDAYFIADGEWFAEIENEQFTMNEKAENALSAYNSYVIENKEKIIEFLGGKNE